MLTRTFVDLTDTLVDDFDVVELLTLLTDRCTEILGVQAAGILLVGADGNLRVVASSSEAMRVLELFEIQSHEGPCLDSYRTGEPVFGLDLGKGDVRWPGFIAKALEAGFHSVHGLPLRLRGNVLGALNLFHAQPNAMDKVDLDVAQALADVATIAIVHHRAKLEIGVLNAQLHQALNSRIVIEQAKGIVAERAGVSVEQAFYALRNHSRNQRLRLSEVAQGVINGSLLLPELGTTPIETS
jgi:GAF domain-containing protein